MRDDAFAKVVLMADAETATLFTLSYISGLPHMAHGKPMLKQRGTKQAFVEDYELAPKG